MLALYCSLSVLLTARADDWQAQWRAQVEAVGVSADDLGYPLTATPQMADFAARATRGCSRGRAELLCLQRALLARGFDYAAGESLTAAEAFEARRGNCLAFTAVFVALARTIGATAVFAALPLTPESGQAEAGVVVVSRHVVAAVYEPDRIHLFDFQAYSSDIRRLTPLSDRTVSALYHANHGAVQLQHGALAEAREILERSAVLAPGWPDIWINLGIVRRQQGELAGAVQAYAAALSLDPGNPQALTNLAWLYGKSGQHEEQRVALKAASRQHEVTPWALIALADAERLLGHPDRARRALRRAWWRAHNNAAVHAGLARHAAAAGNLERAERHARKAAMLAGQ